MRIMVIVFTMLCSFFPAITSSFAACTISENAFVYLHPIFKNTWKFASDSMDISIPQKFCDSRPSRYFATGTADSSAGMAIDWTGNISILIARTVPKEDQCSNIQMLLGEPVSTSLSVTLDQPVAFLSKSTSLDTLYIAYQRNATSVIVASLAKKGIVLKSDTFDLSNPGTKVLRSINGSNTGTLPGFWITGSQGLVRYIPVTSSGLGKETVYDIAVTDTLIYASGLAATSKNGTTYKWSNNKLVRDSALGISVSYANDNMIAGFPDAAVKIGTSWKLISNLPDSVRAASVIHSYEGSVVEFLGKNYSYNRILAINNISKFGSIVPDSLKKYINNGYVQKAFTKTETLTVVISDIDSNAVLPNVILNGSSLFNNTYNLMGMTPDLPCEIGTARMNSDTFKIIIRPDSVIYESNYLLGVTNFICNTCNLTKKKMRFGKPLFGGSYNVVNIRIGDESLQIGNAPTGVSPYPSFSSRMISIERNGNSIICALPNKSHADGTISLWTVDGRLLQNVKFSREISSLTIPIQFSDQMIVSRIKFSDGVYFEQKIFLGLK